MINPAKRVLIISSEFPPNVGGIGNHAYHLARSLSIEGYEVQVMADIIGIPSHELSTFGAQQNFAIAWIERKKLILKTYTNRITSAIKLSFKAEIIICSGKFSLWLVKAIRLFSSKKKNIDCSCTWIRA